MGIFKKFGSRKFLVGVAGMIGGAFVDPLLSIVSGVAYVVSEAIVDACAKISEAIVRKAGISTTEGEGAGEDS